MKHKASNVVIKSLAIFYIALGLLLAGITLPVCAQDEDPAMAEQAEAESAAPAVEKPAPPATPAPAATEQTGAGTQTTAEVSAEKPATEQPSVVTPAPAPVSAEKPAATSAAPAAESPKAADIATPAAAEETEPVSQPEAPAPAAAQAPVVTPAPAPISADKPAATPAAPAAETPKAADIAAPAAAEKTEQVSQPEAPAPAVEQPAIPAPAAPATTEQAEAGTQATTAAVSATPAAAQAPVVTPAPAPVSAEKPAATNAAPAAETPKAADIAAPAVVEKTESVSQPEAPAPAAEKPASSAPAAAKGSDFDLDRGAVNAATIADTTATNKTLTQEELVAAQEEVRRQAKEVEALKALDLAYQAMGRNEFDVALKYFSQAMNAMPVRPHTVETRQKAMQSQAECEYRIALNYYRDGKYQEAKDAIRLALGYYPAHQRAARLSEQIKKDETRNVERAAMPVPPRHATEHLDRVQQIRESINLGRQYYDIGEYEKARREFKKVLVIDEKNDEAAAWLKKVYEKMYNLETDQMNRQQADMVAQVRDTWTPPVKREAAGPEARIQETTITDKGKRRLLEKLNGIVIPQLEFRQANIVDVIKYLDQASIACDKESPQGEKGVNFILQLKRPGAAAETAPIAAVKPAEGEFTGEESAIVTPANLPAVTLSLRNIVLIDAIKYITEVTGLKYRIEENVVVITPSDVVYGELLTKTYHVQPSIAETIIGAAGSAGGGGDKMELGGAAPTVERGDVRKFFVDAGVPFPEGTSIVYKQSLNLLIVKNTADNLERFDQILLSLNVVPQQVEIEARFVEVAQQDLEELGVEWLLTDNWELAENAGAGGSIPLASRERIQMNQNTFSKGLRNLAQGASGVAATPGGNMAGIMSISSILTNPEVTMVLHALEQKSGANLLSAPKVTTKSGANAEIKVVQEWIYPTEFELTPPQVSGSGSGSQAVISKAFVTPAAFQTRDTGVILNVTPTVGPDGFSIDLVMLPQVVELSQWINYGSTLIDPTTGKAEIMNMPQPIFKSRNITTSITIWDGQTVVMGGMITERQTTSLDKIPFLGDIPLLGFLFQSKTSNSEKYNLLIFVTANLVDPAGNKINKEAIATATGGAVAPAAAPTATP